MFKELNSEEINKLISSQLVGRLGCHADGLTYVVPVSYAYHDNCVYVRTFEGRKLGMLRKNPKVCFQVDDTRNLSNWKSVIAWGDFEELLTEEDRNTAIAILGSRKFPFNNSETMHLSNDWPFSPDHSEVRGIFFRIHLYEKTGKCEMTSSKYFYST